MKSMTGYGQASESNEQVEYQVSIRSVNGRFLEPRFHLPKELYTYESDLRKILEKYFFRGTVDIYIHRRDFKTEHSQHLVVQEHLLTQYLQACKKISKKYKIKSAPTVEFVLRNPEFLKIEITASVHKGEDSLMKKVFTQACKSCIAEREREGKALKKEMDALLGHLQKLREEMMNERAQANTLLHDRFKKRIEDKMTEMVMDPQRLAQEIVIQLDRSDINEELQRLEEHLREFQKLLASSEGLGKKLDFYTQELLREVNTIGSKSQVARLTQLVVQAKTTVEKMREQVQNIE